MLTANNMGLMWVAMEGATRATVRLVGLYRTPVAIEAARKYFILCGLGIAQALFGTVLLYFAGELNPGVLTLAFVFLLVGYGTKTGLVPMHSWLSDAHSEGPTPMSAILSGLLLNDARYAIVRSKMLVDGATHIRRPVQAPASDGLRACTRESGPGQRQSMARFRAYLAIVLVDDLQIAFAEQNVPLQDSTGQALLPAQVWPVSPRSAWADEAHRRGHAGR